jgi:outer membrane protein assembly factor BamD (BamD/ComL family)
LESYVKRIPTDKKVIDTLKLDRNQALYELGLIYKEQFKDTKLAIERLERVDTLTPVKELVLPINWHLYKIYSQLDKKKKSTKYKNIILTKYPNTKFAQIIKNPEKPFVEKISLNEIEELYKEIYRIYKDNKFEETVLKVNEFLPTIKNSKLIPKFELLKAYATGKYKDKEAYKGALDFVVVSYGSTDEGKKAKEILKQLNK